MEEGSKDVVSELKAVVDEEAKIFSLKELSSRLKVFCVKAEVSG